MKLDNCQLGFKRLPNEEQLLLIIPLKGTPLLLEEVVAERRVVDLRSHLSFHFT